MMKRLTGSAVLLMLASAAAWAQATGGNPADQGKKQQDQSKQEGHQTYVIQGTKVSDLKEEDLIGPNNQPRWTAARRFPTTRVYVVPPGEIEFEWWARITEPRDPAGDTQERFLYEVEMGLPYRLQIDLYVGAEGTGNVGAFDFTRQQIELRWAIADWDVIFGNPTLYIEYVNRKGEADGVEFKLLFGGEIASGWHWGLNFVLERTLEDELNNEWQAVAGLSYTIIDMLFSLGLEFQGIWEDTEHRRGHFENTYFLGPSAQWRPLPQMHVDVVFLAGLTEESPAFRVWIILGWEF
jgi:hypothetical protein